MRYLVGLVIISALGCADRRNPAACDATHACIDASRPYCDLIHYRCLPAPTSSAVSDLGSALDGGNVTPACSSSAACADGTPLCDDGACRACSGAGDDAACAARSPATARCDGSSGRCVACRVDTQALDCAAQTPICGSDHACHPCSSHAQCASGICIVDGAMSGGCAAASDVARVDNGGQPVATCQATRTLRNGNSAATAYCDVSELLAESAQRSYALVAGSSQPYGGVSLTNRNLTLVGPGRLTPSARLFAQSATAFSVTVNSGAVLVVADGIDLGGDANAKTIKGLACTNTGLQAADATVVFRNGAVHDSSSLGIDSNGCALTVDASIVSDNAGGGIRLASTQYTITNDFIVANGRGANPGVTIDNGSTGTFAFDTVAQNSVSAGLGGIDCGTGLAKPIYASIVWMNDIGGGSQVGAQCTLDSVVTGSSDSHGVALDPAFASPTDFHLAAGTSANLACCVDKIASPSSPHHDHDIDASARPKGAAADIGAHELQ